MICECKVGGTSTYCLVRNLSLDGVLLECPRAGEDEFLEVGDRMTLTDILDNGNAVFRKTTGEVAWLYRRHVGLHFDSHLKDSVDTLRSWLEERNLV